MGESTIQSIETDLFQIPLAEVLTDAKHGDHSHFDVITVRIALADGREGEGYSYTGGRGGHALHRIRGSRSRDGRGTVG